MSTSSVPHTAKKSDLGQLLSTAFDRWTTFWFTPADPIPLCVLRWFVGGMLVYSHLVWGIDLVAFFGNDGWNSAEVIREFQFGRAAASFWWYVPAESMQTVHWISIAVLTLFWFGVCTRVTSVLSFIIHVSYCQRAALANYGLDQILGILTLYLMISPCGAMYSFDSLVRRWWTGTSDPLRKYASAGLAIRLTQVHYCIIYFFASTGKFQGESWWDGSAMWRALANYEYQSMDMTWLAWYPEFLQLVTHIAVIWELSFAYLVWVKPLRPLMLIGGILLHLGIGAFLGMWTFGLTMIFGYLVFVDPDTIRAALRWPFQRISPEVNTSALTPLSE